MRICSISDWRRSFFFLFLLKLGKMLSTGREYECGERERVCEECWEREMMCVRRDRERRGGREESEGVRASGVRVTAQRCLLLNTIQ